MFSKNVHVQPVSLTSTSTLHDIIVDPELYFASVKEFKDFISQYIEPYTSLNGVKFHIGGLSDVPRAAPIARKKIAGEFDSTAKIQAALMPGGLIDQIQIELFKPVMAHLIDCLINRNVRSLEVRSNGWSNHLDLLGELIARHPGLHSIALKRLSLTTSNPGFQVLMEKLQARRESLQITLYECNYDAQSVKTLLLLQQSYPHLRFTIADSMYFGNFKDLAPRPILNPTTAMPADAGTVDSDYSDTDSTRESNTDRTLNSILASDDSDNDDTSDSFDSERNSWCTLL